MASYLNNSTITSGGESYGVQNGSKPWSLTSPGNDEYRFELHDDDQWSGDLANKERTQIYSKTKIPFDQKHYTTFDVRFDTNPQASTADWVSLVGWHATEDSGEPGSPGMLTLHMLNGKFSLISRSDADSITSNPVNKTQLERPSSRASGTTSRWKPSLSVPATDR